MRETTRTPPEIVASAENPRVALAAFIGQELEKWGFAVGDEDGVGFSIDLGDVLLEVEVTDV